MWLMVHSWRFSHHSLTSHLPLHFCHGITHTSMETNNVSVMTRFLTNLCVMRGVSPCSPLHLQIYTWRASKETPPWRPSTWPKDLYNLCLIHVSCRHKRVYHFYPSLTCYIMACCHVCLALIHMCVCKSIAKSPYSHVITC
jgi:hypothetical protein